MDFIPDNHLHRDLIYNMTANITRQTNNNKASNARANHLNSTRQQHRATKVNNNRVYRNNNQIRNINFTDKAIDISQFDRITKDYNF